jgi:hypothetical protein
MSMPATPRKRSGCPLCGRPPADPHAPFCSPRCRDRDLLNWLGEGYRVPGPPAEELPGPEGLDSER